uniref:28S rRNA (uridine-N(3))-methyltransferase n=1 Tax=Phallusia mammillata TaxID=59560 RepID=A0A6F9D8P0_9ASCI|nr:uncharacterized protein C9orf114-like [Phallusia mammillata]
MREDADSPYREGVVLDRPIKSGKGSFVNCGTVKLVQIDKVLQPNVRVTVKMLPETEKHKKYFEGRVVPPETPRTHGALYWGYTIRLASSLSHVLTQCPFRDSGKYDVTIGTSEKGDPVDDFQLEGFKHLLIVFGGVKGLEAGLDNDEELIGISEPRHLFDYYLNTCPIQGSRTIRTEEAILVSLSALRPVVFK